MHAVHAVPVLPQQQRSQQLEHRGLQVAIKFIERGSSNMRGVDREVLNLRLVSLHPYVVKFKEVCRGPHQLLPCRLILHWLAGHESIIQLVTARQMQQRNDRSASSTKQITAGLQEAMHE